MKMISSEKLSRNQFPWVLGLLLYFISYGGSFFHLNAIYWDDWTLFNMDPSVILDTFKQNGAMFSWCGYLHVFLLKAGPGIYRILTFSLMFLSGYLLWVILGVIDAITQLERNLITLLFLVLPLNAARIALIDFPYTLCYFSFFLGWYLLVCRAGLISKMLSLFLFVFSFNTSSLLVFYALPIVHAIYLSIGFDLKKIAVWASKNFLFLISPFVWFYVKNRFFAPYGLYGGYNSFKVGVLLCCAVLFFIVLLLIFIACLLKKRQRTSTPTDRGLTLLFFGVVIIWFGVFPYLAVGIIPAFGDWNSRHQLLMPLGVAVALVGIGIWISYGKALRFSLLALTISCFVNIHSAFEYHVDWIKQCAVMRLISQSIEIKNARTILFDDKTSDFNAHSRRYRFYEYNGWLKLVYADQIRWGMSKDDWPGNLKDKLPVFYQKYIVKLYNASDYIPNKPDLVITIKASHGRLKTALTGINGFTIDCAVLQ